MAKLTLIFLAGGAGSVARYLVAGWTQGAAKLAFPIGTLCVNLLGCLLIGFLVAAFSGRWMVREEYRVMVLVGFLGGFTTFSTFGFETFTLLNDGQVGKAIANVSLSVCFGVTGAWLGYRLAERWLGV